MWSGVTFINAQRHHRTFIYLFVFICEMSLTQHREFGWILGISTFLSTPEQIEIMHFWGMPNCNQHAKSQIFVWNNVTNWRMDDFCFAFSAQEFFSKKNFSKFPSRGKVCIMNVRPLVWFWFVFLRYVFFFGYSVGSF